MFSLSLYSLCLPVFYFLAHLLLRNRLGGSSPEADVRMVSQTSPGSASSTAPTSTCRKKFLLSTMQSKNNAPKLASVSGNHSKRFLTKRRSYGGFSWEGCFSSGKTAPELMPSITIRKFSLKGPPILLERRFLPTPRPHAGIVANCTVSIVQRSSNLLAFRELPPRYSQLACSASSRRSSH